MHDILSRTATALVLLAAVASLFPPRATADVKLPHLLSDRMVLQQSISPAVWGTADGGEEVRVSFRGQKVSSTADKDGRWLVRLAPEPAGGPDDMTITAKNTVVLKDILVGEIWVCSGQSNMGWPVSRTVFQIDIGRMRVQ